MINSLLCLVMLLLYFDSVLLLASANLGGLVLGHVGTLIRHFWFLSVVHHLLRVSCIVRLMMIVVHEVFVVHLQR
jgi:hypothetical protein